MYLSYIIELSETLIFHFLGVIIKCNGKKLQDVQFTVIVLVEA